MDYFFAWFDELTFCSREMRVDDISIYYHAFSKYNIFERCTALILERCTALILIVVPSVERTLQPLETTVTAVNPSTCCRLHFQQNNLRVCKCVCVFACICMCAVNIEEMSENLSSEQRCQGNFKYTLHTLNTHTHKRTHSQTHTRSSKKTHITHVRK